MPEIPRYTELKRRCDACDRDFRIGDIIAAVLMRFEGGSRPYTLIFCYSNAGEKCIHLWRYKYEIRKHTDFEVMEYHGKRGRGGDTGRRLAPLI